MTRNDGSRSRRTIFHVATGCRVPISKIYFFSKNINITDLLSRDTFCKQHLLSFINLVFL